MFKKQKSTVIEFCFILFCFSENDRPDKVTEKVNKMGVKIEFINKYITLNISESTHYSTRGAFIKYNHVQSHRGN